MGATFSRSTTWSTGAVLTATALNGEFNNILSNLTPAGIDDASANVTAMRATRDPYAGATEVLASSLEDELQAIRYQLVQITGNTYWYEDVVASIGGAVPVGSIIGHYDFNAAISVNTSYWAYCDGSVISNASSPIDGETLPDLSNRYLVGFGTEGGGDVDSASWATTAVGNASHQTDLSHTHTGPSHTHTGPSHTHGVGSYQFQTAEWNTTLDDLFFYTSGGSNSSVIGGGTTSESGGSGTNAVILAGGNATYYTSNGTGSSAAGGTGATGASGTGATGSSLSATQSIQPRSVRVRWIMRIQ